MTTGLERKTPPVKNDESWWLPRFVHAFISFPARNLGIIAAIIVAIGSFGGGAFRSKGGVLESLGITFLKYGHGAALSNVLLSVGTFLFIIAWILLGHALQAKHLLTRDSISAPGKAHKDGILSGLYRTLCLWVAPLVLAAPIMSRDIYSYLMQGALLGHDIDPYKHGASAYPSPYLFEVSPDWRNTTTPYGPLHLWIGEIITGIAGDNIVAGIFLYKLISIAGFALIAYSIPRIAYQLGGNPYLALWLGVMNPVMVFHLIGGMHNESIMVGLVSYGLLLALRKQVFPGIAVIAVAVSLKATAAFILPFIVWIAVNNKKDIDNTPAKSWARFAYTALIGAVITIAVLGVITFVSGSNWGWLSQLTGNTKVINPLAFPTFVTGILSAIAGLFTEDFPYNDVLAFVRTLSMIFMAVGMLLCWWFSRKSRLSAVRGAIGAYCVAFFFNAVTLPWYYASIISLVGAVRPPRWLLKLSVLLSIIIAFAFTGSGNHQLYNVVWVFLTTALAWFAVHFIFPLEESPASSPQEQ